MQVTTERNCTLSREDAIGLKKIVEWRIEKSPSHKIETRTYQEAKKIAKILSRSSFSRFISLRKKAITIK